MHLVASICVFLGFVCLSKLSWLNPQASGGTSEKMAPSSFCLREGTANALKCVGSSTNEARRDSF